METDLKIDRNEKKKALFQGKELKGCIQFEKRIKKGNVFKGFWFTLTNQALKTRVTALNPCVFLCLCEWIYRYIYMYVQVGVGK